MDRKAIDMLLLAGTIVVGGIVVVSAGCGAALMWIFKK